MFDVPHTRVTLRHDVGCLRHHMGFLDHLVLRKTVRPTLSDLACDSISSNHGQFDYYKDGDKKKSSIFIIIFKVKHGPKFTLQPRTSSNYIAVKKNKTISCCCCIIVSINVTHISHNLFISRQPLSQSM